MLALLLALSTVAAPPDDSRCLVIAYPFADPAPIKHRSCSPAHALDGERRVLDVPWRAVVKGDRLPAVSVRFQAHEPVPLPAPQPIAADPSVPLSTRYTQPSPDRGVRLVRLDYVDPSAADSDAEAILKGISGASFQPNIPVYQRDKTRELATCTLWVGFDERGRARTIDSTAPNACKGIPGPFVEALLWRWSPPMWDGKPVTMEVPLVHAAVGVIEVADGERFRPVYVGDTRVSDVPFPLDLPNAGPATIHQLASIEAPRIPPDLLIDKLGLPEKTSSLTCQVDVWAQPDSPHPYALRVHDCPSFFLNVTRAAFEGVQVAPVDAPTHFVHPVRFDWDDDNEAWSVHLP